MKTFKLKKSYVHDLCYVVATTIKEKSEKLDFKEVLHLQKAVNYMLDVVKDFSEALDKLNKEKEVFINNANTKIAAYKKSLQKKPEVEGQVDEDYQKKLDAFVQGVLEDAQAEINAEIAPAFDKLYKELGAEEVELELDEEKMKMLVINFELYAKEKYTNKSAMVEVYEILISANSK